METMISPVEEHTHLNLETVDSNGICFLCLVKVNSDSLKAPNPRNLFRLRNIYRYFRLRKNHTEISHKSKNNENNEPGNEDVLVPLCNRCTGLTGNFMDLLNSLEIIELKLSDCLRNIHKVMSEFESCKDVLGDKKTKGKLTTSRRFEKLREETLNICTAKMRSIIPRVELQRISGGKYSVTMKLLNVKSKPVASTQKRRRGRPPKKSKPVEFSGGGETDKVPVPLVQIKCEVELDDEDVHSSAEVVGENDHDHPTPSNPAEATLSDPDYDYDHLCDEEGSNDMDTSYDSIPEGGDSPPPAGDSLEFEPSILNEEQEQNQDHSTSKHDSPEKKIAHDDEQPLEPVKLDPELPPSIPPKRKRGRPRLHNEKTKKPTSIVRGRKRKNSPPPAQSDEMPVKKRKGRPPGKTRRRKEPQDKSGEDAPVPDSSEPEGIDQNLDEVEDPDSVLKKKFFKRPSEPYIPGGLLPLDIPDKPTLKQCVYCNYLITARSIKSRFWAYDFHLIRFHGDHYLPDLRKDFISFEQFQRIIQDLLFQDFIPSDVINMVQIPCPFCPKMYGSVGQFMNMKGLIRVDELKLHLLHSHREKVLEKLEAIQNDPNLPYRLSNEANPKARNCSYCGTYFNNLYRTKNHEHYYCPQNPKSVEAMRNQKRILKVPSTLPEKKCKHCGETNNTDRFFLSKHRRICKVLNKKRIICEGCGESVHPNYIYTHRKYYCVTRKTTAKRPASSDMDRVPCDTCGLIMMKKNLASHQNKSCGKSKRKEWRHMALEGVEISKVSKSLMQKKPKSARPRPRLLPSLSLPPLAPPTAELGKVEIFEESVASEDQVPSPCPAQTSSIVSSTPTPPSTSVSSVQVQIPEEKKIWQCGYCNCQFRSVTLRSHWKFERHLIRFHIEHYFQDVEKESHVTALQFHRILHDLLFKDFIPEDWGSSRRLQCPLCPESYGYSEEVAKRNGTERLCNLQLHLVKSHWGVILEKLRSLQNDPEMQQKLDSCEGKFCRHCGNYFGGLYRIKEHEANHCLRNSKTRKEPEEGEHLIIYNFEEQQCQLCGESSTLDPIFLVNHRSHCSRSKETVPETEMCSDCGTILTASYMYTHKARYCSALKNKKDFKRTCPHCGKLVCRLPKHIRVHCKAMRSKVENQTEAEYEESESVSSEGFWGGF